MPPLIGRRRSFRKRGTKAWERYMIITRAAAYFGREVDEEKAWSSARSITAEELREFLQDLGPGPDFRFSGRFYTVRGSELVEGSSWDEIREAVVETARVWGESAVRALEILMGADDGLTEREFSAKLKVEGIPYSKEFVRWLLDLGLAVRMPDGRICKLEEAKKPIRDAIEELNSRYRRMDSAARSEMPEIMRMEAEFQAALREALEKRFDEVVEFGRGFSSTTLADRLRSTFGDLLYYDILLAVAQQYSIADAPVISAATGTVTMRTGFNLALFGEPGTGKSFSIATMILGDERRAIPPHGLPGRNRYCGGMTPAKFIRLGQAYEGLRYNFIVPEFNDWFRYCLTYDSLVLTADGGLVPIGELVERRESLEVLTVNPRTLELEAVRIADFSSREVDRLIELRTESGKLLRLTEDHPLPVMTRQGIIWKPAREFEVGDYVISLTAIPELTANDGGRGAISKSGLQKYVLVLRRLSPENSSDHALRVAERLALGPLVFEKIVEKRLLTGRFRVYDIAVPGNRNFFANAILVHNSGMVEALKLAMEHGTIRYETARRTIGPYRFTCFLSVAYNTRVGLRGYEVTVSDPNFNAIEERMLCRLHRMTKERYVEIAKKQMEMALGRVRLEGSETLRAHLTLVHAAETGHPLVRGRLAERPVVVDEGVYEAVSRARDAVLSEIPGDRPGFSPRLEIRAIQLASALALMRYFAEDSEGPIKIDDGSLKLAIRFYVEEAAVRSREMFDPAQVLSKLAVDV